MQPEAVYQKGHRWFNQEERNYGPPGGEDDYSEYNRWATSNMVLIHLRALDDLDPNTVSREDAKLAEQADNVLKNILMEVVGGWEALFGCVGYILESDSLNLSDQGKKGVRKAFEVLIKLNAKYPEFKEGFDSTLASLDEHFPAFKT